MEEQLVVEGREITITQSERLLWPEAGVRKIDYIRYLVTVAPYLLPYTRDRLLMIWFYPHGIGGKRIEKRSKPESAPSWLASAHYKGKQRMFLNDLPTLVWLANYGAQEIHVPFDRYQKTNYPTELVFDLDPSRPDDFTTVLSVALQLRDVLASLGLTSYPKTSGATGLQIYVPIHCKYAFEQTRLVNQFVAKYLLEQLPTKITVDRVVSRRGNKLYFDYLQLWKGRTMAAPYSVRGTLLATVSTPVTWREVEHGFHPRDFTVATIPRRLIELGDPFQFVTATGEEHRQSLDAIITFLSRKSKV